MSDVENKATLSKGRQSWCVIFRHPVCKGPDGKQKLRVRRGLGTSDRKRAEELVAELNSILAAKDLWSPAGREVAATRYDQKVVDAFFSPMLPDPHDPWGIREKVIPLPGGPDSEDGFVRALLLGTTGSGKTTVVRQLLGTDPKTERFPSTSAAKTTICDLEAVLMDGPYRGVVSFLPKDRVRQYIEECVMAACVAGMNGRSRQEVLRRLLEHSDQRFRLSYVIGNPETLSYTSADVDDEFEDETVEESTGLSAEERSRLLARIEEITSELSVLSKQAVDNRVAFARELSISLNEASREELEALQELVEDKLAGTELTHTLVDSILDDVEARFQLIDKGELALTDGNWPSYWKIETNDRADFLESVGRFSSNHAGSFGRLLTPVVDGIRVAGPFGPAWDSEVEHNLVLLDGQGIGHTADAASSLSTGITSRFRIVDCIVLVDNAAQPLQAAPCAVLQTLVMSGYEEKLLLAFTHFDAVVGDNLSSLAAKKTHVIGSFENAVHAIGRSHGREAESSLRKVLHDGRVVFLANIHEKLDLGTKPGRFAESELRRLVNLVRTSRVPPAPIEFTPIYDVANLVLAIQKAAVEFQDRWGGILGRDSRSTVPREHWGRIKALSRRLGYFRLDEYDTLRPVSDLIRCLQIYISQFLLNPMAWEPEPPPSDLDKTPEAVDRIKNEVFTMLHELARKRVLEEHLREWIEAYDLRGKGSTFERANSIVDILQEAAPIPSEIPRTSTQAFLTEMRRLIAKAVESGGGRLRGWSDTDQH